MYFSCNSTFNFTRTTNSIFSENDHNALILINFIMSTSPSFFSLVATPTNPAKRYPDPRLAPGVVESDGADPLSRMEAGRVDGRANLSPPMEEGRVAAR